jgi:hypothetical protein
MRWIQRARKLRFFSLRRSRERVLAGLVDGGLGGADGVLAAAAEALGGLVDFLVLGVSVTPRLTRAMTDLLHLENETLSGMLNERGQAIRRSAGSTA